MKFDVIYADPPWMYRSRKTGGSMKSGAAQNYDVMTLEDLKKIPVHELASDNCYLVMWWVNPMPEEAIELVKSWGFKLKNMNGIVWGKLTAKEKLDFGMGYTTRSGTESCIIAVKGRPKPASRSVRAFFLAKKGKHSCKPDEARAKVEAIAGSGRKIELFHRGIAKKGWTVFGNQSYPSLVLDEAGFRQPYLCELSLQLEQVKELENMQ